MSNPFAATVAAPTNGAAAVPAPTAATNPLGIGDPFAAPSGPRSGERIQDMVDRLLLVKPLEIIKEMDTENGPAENVVSADIAILDHPTEPGHVAEGVLIFQTALKREAAAIYNGPLPYLLGRLNKGKNKKGNTLYTFEEASEADTQLARDFLKVRTL